MCPEHIKLVARAAKAPFSAKASNGLASVFGEVTPSPHTSRSPPRGDTTSQPRSVPIARAASAAIGTNDPRQDITDLLARASLGDRKSESHLLELIYENLRDIARSTRPNRRHDETLSTTVLAHETYLRMFGTRDMAWASRRQFFAYAAGVMRNLLVDNARRKAALKRGGDLERDTDALDALHTHFDACAVLAADQALTALAALDPRLAAVVELHVFVGMQFDDIAAHLDISERTVFRCWQLARLALKNLMS